MFLVPLQQANTFNPIIIMPGKPFRLFNSINTIPTILDQKVYPSLNGLRGISICFVLLQHYLLNFQFMFPGLHFLGSLGVDIFFVISGFLITTLLIKEKVNNGTISLKKFYLKRALRILPVAYLYIAVIAILNYFFKLDIAFSSFIFALSFLMNISISRAEKFDWYVAHYWSLSTEEQFYAFFPFILKKFPKAFVVLIVFIVAAVPFLYLAAYVFPKINFALFAAALRYLIKFQSISVGCLFSLLLFHNVIHIKKYTFVISLVCILVIAYFKHDPAVTNSSVFTNLLTSIAIGLLIICNLHPQRSPLFWLLNSKALSLVGILSYSIYIWQQLFMANNTRFIPSQLPYNIIFLLAVPALSYYFFERYFLKIKERLAKKS